MKALLILLAAAWITTDANATCEREHAPTSTYLYAAVRPATDDAFALAPEVNANTVDTHPPIASPRGSHRAIVLLDQAGWHGKKVRSHPQRQKQGDPVGRPYEVLVT